MSNENNHENMASQQAENLRSSNAEKPAILGRKQEHEDSDLGQSCLEKVNKLTLNDEQSERNTGVVIKNVENESLNSLLVYDSDSSSSSSSSEMMKLNLNWQSREDSDNSTTSSSSSSEEDEESDSDSDEEPSVAEPTVAQSRGAIRKNRPPSKTNELEQLPPVPDLSALSINVENEEFIQMGNVLGIVDKLVTVAALPTMPAYDLDTLLFLDNGKRPLGFVFDVLGQVTSPIYAIRFNSVEDIKSLGVEVGTKVYSAPTSKHTQYVFLQQLLKLKGSDASWKGDTECPPEFADFSDDENECYHRYGNRRPTPNMKRTSSSDSYKKFETTMNKRNLLNTKFNKYMDSYKQARLHRAAAVRRPQAPQINTALASFDPSVPPPAVRHQMYYGGGGVHYMQPEYWGIYYEGVGGGSGSGGGGGGGGENNNSQGYATPSFYVNNFVANLSQTNSANYFTNHAGNNHPGPSHE